MDPTSELIVDPHQRWVNRVNGPEVREFYERSCRKPNYDKEGIVDLFTTKKEHVPVDS